MGSLTGAITPDGAELGREDRVSEGSPDAVGVAVVGPSVPTTTGAALTSEGSELGIIPPPPSQYPNVVLSELAYCPPKATRVPL